MWSVAFLLGILIHEPGLPVELGEQRIQVRVHGRVVDVELTQPVTNKNLSSPVEAAYEFFVPAGARVVGFSVDGKDGVFAPYDSANELYPFSYGRRDDKGLLCQVVEDFYRVSLAVQKQATFKVRYRFLRTDRGLRIPLGAPRVSVSVETGGKNVRCESHKARIDGPKAVFAGLGGKDFVLSFEGPNEGKLPAGKAVDEKTALRVGMAMNPPRSFLGRAVRWRASRLNTRAGGGSGMTENAVELGLYWLSKKTVRGGGWGSDATTSLCLLAFLSTGYVDRGPGRNKYAPVVRDAAAFLLRERREEGTLRTQALRTLALLELYWMVRDPKYREPAREGLRQLLANVNWDGDAEVAAWTAQALRVALWAGLPVKGELDKARNAFRLEPNDPASLLAHHFLGFDPKHGIWKHGIERLSGAELFFATHATFQVGSGRLWNLFNKGMKVAMVSTQAPKNHEHAGSWGNDLERTAYGCLTLEVYYRFPRTRLPLRR